MSKKKTGLGAAAFFQKEPAGQPESEQEEGAAEVEAPKPKKVRTTVTLYPDTLATMEMLKVEARRQGEKATYSDILEEAILDLARKKGVEL
ncbi:MAG: hypothetical protein M3220_19145 [Chloroflexota bacterium]|nr:hypothetical protein [Chloroflexota bacterium]